MKQTLKTLALTSALTLAASLASAATAFTDPVGAMSITCKANSDTYISIPFARAADFQGTLSGVPTGSGATRTLAITGSPTFTVDQFKDLWYVKFTSGPLNGRYYTVTANAVSTLTININGDTTVDSAVATNSFKLIKYWTVGALFPSGQTTVPAVSSEFDPTIAELHIPDYSGLGTDLPNANILFPIDDGSYRWVNSNDTSTTVDNFILPPDGFVVVRNFQASPTTFVASGSVIIDQTATPVFGQQSALQDNPIGLARPKNATLATLFSAGTPFVETTSEFDTDGDQLLYFDNATISGFNQPSSKIFIKVAGDWLDTSDTSSPANGFVIPASGALFVRKVNNGIIGGQTTFFINQPNY